MKKLIFLLLVLSAVSACFAGAYGETKEIVNAIEDAAAAYVDAIDMEYAYQLTLQLSTDPTMQDNVLGFRTSGSSGEHAAANFIASEMEKIGLQDVEKIPVSVDSWQFSGASLKISGTEIDIMPVSYMATGVDGLTAELIDCGTGFAADYEGKDVKDKIVLIGVDQWNEAWIDEYIYEAELHGAAALVTYDLDGYGRWSDDVYQIQDVCCEDIMPTVIITANQYKDISSAMAEGHTECTLVVESVISQGTSYDVVGKIPGRSSDQQIIFSGHYDMYFTGFQDDCSAIGTVMSVGKAIIDSGYQPEYDILIVAHGAEEWGASGTEFDWTRGAWELINNVHPEWASKTIALFNFELSAYDLGVDTFMIACVPEYASLVSELVEAGLLDDAVEGFSAIDPVSYDTTTMEDGISYRNAGVPYFLNAGDTCVEIVTDTEYSWTELHYHTDSDDASTYSEKMMKANIAVFGTIAIYLDQMPAVELDLTATCDDLAESFDAEYAAEAGVDVEKWTQNLTVLRAAAEAWNARIEDVNSRFTAAVADRAASEDLDVIRQEGRTLNAKTLAAFKDIQDAFIGIEFSSDVVIRHIGYMDNVALIDGVLAALETGELYNEEETGALDLAWRINALREYGYYIFSPEAAEKVNAHTNAESNTFKWWGENKGYTYAHTSDATISLLEKAESGNVDFSKEIQIYQTARAEQLVCMAAEMNAEIEKMQSIAEMLEK